MPARNQKFINNEFYHITLRRMGEALLFKNIDDYFRGVFSIYEFNTLTPVTIRERRIARLRIKQADREANRDPGLCIDTRDPLVEILVFCLMPNHIHLLLKQVKEGGISKYINKIGAGYPAYFKKKYDINRRGHFFQDRFNAVHIKTDEQLIMAFIYIHINPISLIEPGWKEKGIKNPEKTVRFLEEDYRWSSFWDYIGIKNFPSITERKLFIDLIGSEQKCRELIEDWVKNKNQRPGSL
jgi:putative transposase